MDCVVFVQLDHDIPDHMWHVMGQARKLWEGKIILIAPQREEPYQELKDLKIDFVSQEKLYGDSIQKYDETTFLKYPNWDGFWDNACKRFFYMRLLQQKYIDIQHIIYIENDVIPYIPIQEMFDKFKVVYNNKIVFSPFCPDQLSCCFMYIDNPQLLATFCINILSYFKLGISEIRKQLPTQEIVNETTLAYMFYKDRPDVVDLFPIMPIGGFNKGYEQLGFFVDPFAYGQWIGGRRINPGVPWAHSNDWIGREILNKNINVEMFCEGQWNTVLSFSQRPMITTTEKEPYPLATLHMHSKRIEKWM